MMCWWGGEARRGEGSLGRTLRKAEDGASPFTCAAILVGVEDSEWGIESFCDGWLAIFLLSCYRAVADTRIRLCLAWSRPRQDNAVLTS